MFLLVYIGTEEPQCRAEAGWDAVRCKNRDICGNPPEEGEPKTEDKANSEASAGDPCEVQQ